jgi:hypothetical protein
MLSTADDSGGGIHTGADERHCKNSARGHEPLPPHTHHATGRALMAKNPREKTSSTTAKLIYRPIGLLSGIVSGAIAGAVFKQIWKRASPGHKEDSPKALESEYSLREVLLAAAIQGALFALVKALVDRVGARAFERATGSWPGD